MNERLAGLFARRSVRRFTSRTVDEATVRDLLEAAMAAPSAMATDPWSFVVVRARGTLARMAEILPHGAMLHEAPLAILVCGDRSRMHRGEESYMIQDCSAAVENLLIAASLLGLGACWIGTHPNADRIEGLARLLGVPAGMIPFATIAVGHPAECPPPRTRFDASRVHQERWQGAN